MSQAQSYQFIHTYTYPEWYLWLNGDCVKVNSHTETVRKEQVKIILKKQCGLFNSKT